MEQTPTSSRRMLIVGIVAIMALIATIAIVATLLFGTARQEPATSSVTESSSGIATKEQVKENLSDLDATIKQAAKDQAAAKSAQKDGDNQIKVGS
jgi:carbon starvation protein CstA